jgi:hypothetical protein
VGKPLELALGKTHFVSGKPLAKLVSEVTLLNFILLEAIYLVIIVFSKVTYV